MINKIRNWFKKNNSQNVLSAYEKIDNLFDSLSEDIIHLQIGSDLVPFGESIVNLVSSLREEIKEECGFIIPPVRINEGAYIQENEIVIYIRQKRIKNIYVIPNEDGIKEEVYETLKTVIYEYLDKIFSNEVAEKYINTVQKNNSWLIWNLTNVIPVTDIKTILVDIINKGKSINNINYIFEQIGKQVLSDGSYRDCLKTRNPHVIARQIAKSL